MCPSMRATITPRGASRQATISRARCMGGGRRGNHLYGGRAVPRTRTRGRRSWARAPGAARPRVLPRRVYFLSAAFFSAGALDADFAIDVVGTMMWAYGVPFHITHGPPLVQSVGYASS